MTVTVVRADSFEWANEHLTSGSVPLFVMDPPYGGILKNAWDKVWTIEDQWNLTKIVEFALSPGGTAYIWGGVGKPHNRIFFEWLSQVERRSLLTLWDLITWSKKRAYGVKDRYLFTREECAVLIKGDRPKIFHIPLLEKERGYAGYNKDYPAKSKFLRRTNVWTDVTELFKGKIHDAEKPSRLAEIMIETSSNPGDLVVDLFAGSGSTGVAAAKLRRNAILVEKSDCAMHTFVTPMRTRSEAKLAR